MSRLLGYALPGAAALWMLVEYVRGLIAHTAL